MFCVVKKTTRGRFACDLVFESPEVETVGSPRGELVSAQNELIESSFTVGPTNGAYGRDLKMKCGYRLCVPDVSASLAFFEKAFGNGRRFVHESGGYGELGTGETTRAFAAHGLGAMNLPTGYGEASSSPKPLGIEVGLVTPAVVEAHENAVRWGATEIKAPETKPWAQVVSYVRCPDGTLVELCSPVGA